MTCPSGNPRGFRGIRVRNGLDRPMDVSRTSAPLLSAAENVVIWIVSSVRRLHSLKRSALNRLYIAVWRLLDIFDRRSTDGSVQMRIAMVGGRRETRMSHLQPQFGRGVCLVVLHITMYSTHSLLEL